MSERIDSGRASGARDVRLFPRVNERLEATSAGPRPVGEQTTRRVADFHPSAPPGAGLAGRPLGGRYTLTGLLGRGGFGAVYHALQAPIERPVAVKVTSGGQDPADLRRRFLLKARAAPHPRRARSPATPVDCAKVDMQLCALRGDALVGCRSTPAMIAPHRGAPPNRRRRAETLAGDAFCPSKRPGPPSAWSHQETAAPWLPRDVADSPCRG